MTHYDINGYQTMEWKTMKTKIRVSVSFHAISGVEYEVLEHQCESKGLVGSLTFYKFERKSFGVVYRPNAVRFTRFIDLLESLLHFLRAKKNDCNVFGDFDVRTLN